MKTLTTPLTTFSLALVMAFAFSGPVAFTSTPAQAGDWWNMTDTSPGPTDEWERRELLGDMASGLITPAYAGDEIDCFFNQDHSSCFGEDGQRKSWEWLLLELETE
ncbi:MAG: hypothetical protein V6Z81_09285 [Parvularculales bacterium]